MPDKKLQLPLDWMTSDQRRASQAVVALYDEALLSDLRSALPEFVGPERELEFPKIMRAWAHHYAEIMICRASSPSRAEIRDDLQRLNKIVIALIHELDALHLSTLNYLTSVVSVFRGGSPLSGLLNPNHLLLYERISAIREFANWTDVAAENFQVSRGTVKKLDLKVAIFDLAWVFEYLTGLRAARRVRLGGEYEGTEYGPFAEFVSRAIAPIWPSAGKAQNTLKSALKLWNRIPRHEPLWRTMCTARSNQV